MYIQHQETVVSRAKFTRSARRISCIFTRDQKLRRAGLSNLNNGWADW